MRPEHFNHRPSMNETKIIHVSIIVAATNPIAFNVRTKGLLGEIH
jgi:hypothetical protein